MISNLNFKKIIDQCPINVLSSKTWCPPEVHFTDSRRPSMYYIEHVDLGDFVDGVKQQCISNVWNWIETNMSRTEN